MIFWNDSQGHNLSPLTAPWGRWPGGRLTLTTATPVTTSDVTGVSTVYYTPYISDLMSLWNGVSWQTLTFSEISTNIGAGSGFAQTRLTVAGTTTASSPVVTMTSTAGLAIGDLLDLSANFMGDAAIMAINSGTQVTMSKNCLAGGGGNYTLYFYIPVFDFFASFDANQNVVLTSQPWASQTTRTTALALTDGFYTLSTDKTKLYLGTLAFSQVHLNVCYASDSAVFRGVWNNFNRVPRSMLFQSATTNWTYTGGWRQANGDPTAKVTWVRGLNEDPVPLEVMCCLNSGTSTAGNVNIGLDSATVGSADNCPEVSATNPGGLIGVCRTVYHHPVAPGYHYATWMENTRVGPITFYGNYGGNWTSCLRGTVWG